MTAHILSSLMNYHEFVGLKNARATIRVWRERTRARRELARCSERELQDIGVSWSTVAEEVNKPFWRA